MGLLPAPSSEDTSATSFSPAPTRSLTSQLRSHRRGESRGRSALFMGFAEVRLFTASKSLEPNSKRVSGVTDVWRVLQQVLKGAHSP